MVNLDYVLETFTKEGSQSTFTVTIIFTNYYSNPGEVSNVFCTEFISHARSYRSKATLPALKKCSVENKAEF